MTRAVSNLLIVLTMAIVVTIVMAVNSSGTGVDDAEVADTDAPATATLPDDGTGDVSATPAQGDGAAGGRPSYLDPEPVEALPGPATEVLGVTVVQESDSGRLADTGAGGFGRWIVLAAGIAATGGLVRNAGRDHAEGDLRLLP